MYGDTTVIRHLAAGLRDQAEEIRQRADELVGRADATPWRGRAADAMRAGVRRHAGELRGTADLHDDAATALLRHARQVEETLAVVAGIERAAQLLIEAARGRLADLAGGVADAVGLGGLGDLGDLGDAADRVLARFAPPPPGHLAWLRVDLPGLRA